ncbi:MAG: RNA polymerase factor sigma-32 [Alphaproteobacteria bacterium]
MQRDTISTQFAALMRQPRLTRGEERALLGRMRRGDTAATARLVLSHLRFVVHIARRYRHYGHPLTDLIQEGMVGLMLAVRRFNPDRDVRLATYAMWWIRAAIQDYVVRSRSLVRIGTTAAQKSLFFNLRRRIGELVDSESVSDDFARALADRFNISVADIVGFARRIARPDQSLEAPTGEDGTSRLIDLVRDERPTPEDALVTASEGRFWHERLRDALAVLPPRELLIIRRRFLADKAPSRAALGVELGLSKERVRQLEVRALGRLRDLLQALRDGVEPLPPQPV